MYILDTLGYAKYVTEKIRSNWSNLLFMITLTIVGFQFMLSTYLDLFETYFSMTKNTETDHISSDKANMQAKINIWFRKNTNNASQLKTNCLFIPPYLVGTCKLKCMLLNINHLKLKTVYTCILCSSYWTFSLWRFYVVFTTDISQSLLFYL